METERLKEGVVGYVFFEVVAAQSEGEAVTVTVVMPEWGVVVVPWREVLWPGAVRRLFVPETALDDAALPEVAMVAVPELLPEETVIELLLTGRLDGVPEEIAEDGVDVGPLLMLADEDGSTAEES